MALAYVALGSNQGERRCVIRLAIQLLGEESRIAITAVSPLIETRPVGGPDDQDTYLNGAIELQTDLAPRVLLVKLLGVEQALGRVRGERWGSRSIDLDLLLYDQDVIELPEFPMTPSGKVRKIELRAAALNFLKEPDARDAGNE